MAARARLPPPSAALLAPGLLVCGLLLGSGCNSILGAEDPEVVEGTIDDPPPLEDADPTEEESPAAAPRCGDGKIQSYSAEDGTTVIEECDDGDDDDPDDGCHECVVACGDGATGELKSDANHCYRFVGKQTTDRLDWEGAKAHCEAEWGEQSHLVTLEDLDELGLLQDMLAHFEGTSVGTGAWVGASGDGGAYTWIGNGDVEEDWFESPPPSAGCVLMSAQTYGLAVTGCTEEPGEDGTPVPALHAFVCEYDPPGTPPPPPTEPSP
jgi:hypothetical protein